jgi:hypothetical protein
MSVTNNGGPAFPTSGSGSPDDGMTLRDYFAGIALPIQAARYVDGHEEGWLGIAEEAYDVADAMLKARQE